MLGKVIQGLVKNAVRNAVNFETAIDPLIAQLEESCPPREVIDRILTQKNQLTQALTQTQTALTTITDTSSTIDTVLTGVNTAVQTIKLLPIPSSVPPGIGIPLNVINGFSSALDTLGTIIKEGQGTVTQVTPAIDIITDNINTIQDKLSQLDNLVAGCLIDETEGLTDSEKEEFFNNLGINFNTEDVDEDVLNANSNDPLTYKGFTITLDTNAGNKFSFPQRRAIAENKNTGQKLVGPFSYSSSTQVLIDTIKFEIDKITKPTLAEATNDIAVAPAPADPTPPPVPSNTIDDSQETSSATSTPTPPNPYTPFNGPGENLEVKLRGSKLWQYRADQTKWTEFFPNFSPFDNRGAFDGAVNSTINRDVFPVVQTYYKWNQKFYRWEFDYEEENV